MQDFGTHCTPDRDFPVIRLAADQILRLNAIGTTLGVPCHATLSFRDAQNATIGPSLEVSLGPHQAAFLDLDASTLGLGLFPRTSVRPVLTHFRDSGPCSSSFQLVNASTALVLATLLSPSGPSDPSEVVEPSTCPGVEGQLPGLGLLDRGIVELALVRTTLPNSCWANAAPPCAATMQIFDNGNLVASQTVDLAPGQSATLSASKPNFGEFEVDVIPTYQTVNGASTFGCMASAQIIDPTTPLGVQVMAIAPLK